MKKVWNLNGSMSLLSLADGFFLMKFTSLEDLDKVWMGGPWFLLGKPFILQRWSPKFQPVRDESASILLWIKIINLPLALWSPTGISRIASYVGIPISVDSLTANGTRLTFARVCVQINKNSPLHDVISIEIDGDDMDLKVVYDWKPTPCEGCGSLFHPFSLCSSNRNPKPSISIVHRPRGRSMSRHPNSKNLSTSAKPPIPRPTVAALVISPPSQDAVIPSGIGPSNSVISPKTTPTKYVPTSTSAASTSPYASPKSSTLNAFVDHLFLFSIFPQNFIVF
ncbi:uncharacterized protein LOC110108800 [Dendrobium catenatum]|uniref:uncharacterized protein LOC110108800 n=1 Tax=Dendrobium catenatum TaxID=906689 RepID=UPI0009F25F68|nr:uncharacterized protein LOC110108800 [Dendrobium catenatum]